MFVIATAGHVDHGKSTLVRALTGMEPDRWAEERTRGMTIDLGYAWTTLPAGPTLAFVDVPGHERFIGNMLAGIGPAPAVLMVVSADAGWRAQSAEHLAAIDALDLRHGLLVITRSDLADPGPATTSALHHIRDSSLRDVQAVQVSARTGAGMDVLRHALAAVALEMPDPRIDGRVRLWVDRAFRIRGAGTVVTGTLAEGSLAVGDTLSFDGEVVRIRGLQSLGRPADRVQAVSRVALNVKGAAVDRLRRGSQLLTPDSWAPTTVVDARTRRDADLLPSHGVLHAGTGDFPVHIRPLARRIVRITLPVPVALQPGDRGILRDPGRSRLEGGAQILDVAPPALRRRGAGARRGAELAAAAAVPTTAAEVERRGAIRIADLQRLGIEVADTTGLRREGSWLISERRWQEWVVDLVGALDRHDAAYPLQPGMPLVAAQRKLAIPDPALLRLVAEDAGLTVARGRMIRPGSVPSLGPADAAVREVESRLQIDPFAAPERTDLAMLGLGKAELAAAEHVGRLIRLTDDIVLLPQAPLLALAILRTLRPPFTTSQARQALGTTRRVAIPLLEYLDRAGWTRQAEPGSRTIRLEPSI